MGRSSLVRFQGQLQGIAEDRQTEMKVGDRKLHMLSIGLHIPISSRQPQRNWPYSVHLSDCPGQ